MVGRWLVVVRPVGQVLLGLALLLLMRCGGGASSSGGGFADQALLRNIEFPDAAEARGVDVTPPPDDAPLIQRVAFLFDEAPDPDTVSRLTVQIRDAEGIPARGRFEVVGPRVVFTPDLPLRPATPTAEGLDGGGAGLDPDRLYSVRIGPRTWSFVGAVDPDLRARYPDPGDPDGVSLSFRTTADPARAFAGMPQRSPRVTQVWPANGATDVSPQLYSDPRGEYATREPFRLEFDTPLNPEPGNLGFLLVDVEDTTRSPAGLELGVEARLVVNEPGRSVVEVQASGILPFGRLLSLEVPRPLASLSASIVPSAGSEIATTFTTTPSAGEVFDQLHEDFHSTARRDEGPGLLGPGVTPAAWNVEDSGVLTAAFAFDGAGELGRFAPAAPPDGEERVLVLDTNRQAFPLLDGSTPDAPVGAEVSGGVFHFTSIEIPRNVVIEARGGNPLVFTATGEVEIAGKILVDGRHGTPENAFDSAVTSIPGGPGGAGGGRGGESHPILFWPPDQVSTLTLVSPPRGGRGFGPGNAARIGGGGGEGGTLDTPRNGEYGTDQEINCRENNANDNDDRAAGGSGGSFLTKGQEGRLGAGNTRSDARGGYTVVRRADDRRHWKDLYPGEPGVHPFADGDPTNDFIGLGGEVSELIGGQGGGGGGSRAESYFCGHWCRVDEDPGNDQLCGAEFGDPPRFAGSVGDARGGSAGGGGGAVMIQALGPIAVRGSSRISARGGRGAGGEVTGNSRWGGPAGSGSGGAIVLQSAAGIRVARGAEIDVRWGNTLAAGGHGIIQLQVPPGQVAQVEDEDSLTPADSWVDRPNLLNPARFTPLSEATSRWFDLGRSIDRAPAGTNPVFGIRGLDAEGYVRTDDEGRVLDPAGGVRCDYLGQLDPFRPGRYREGQEPRADFVPPNATVQVLFQGARAVVAGSKEVDPATRTAWTPDPSELSAHQFLRYRVRFDIAADGRDLRADNPRPSVQSIRIDSLF